MGFRFSLGVDLLVLWCSLGVCWVFVGCLLGVCWVFVGAEFNFSNLKNMSQQQQEPSPTPSLFSLWCENMTKEAETICGCCSGSICRKCLCEGHGILLKKLEVKRVDVMLNSIMEDLSPSPPPSPPPLSTLLSSTSSRPLSQRPAAQSNLFCPPSKSPGSFGSSTSSSSFSGSSSHSSSVPVKKEKKERGTRTGKMNWNQDDHEALLFLVKTVLPMDDSEWEKIEEIFTEDYAQPSG